MDAMTVDPAFWTRVGRGFRRALVRSGGYVRKAARHSIKTRKNRNAKSAPGTPPHNHVWLKNSILFAVDDGDRSVVVGAELREGRDGRTNAAHVNEVGGSFVRRTRRIGYEVGKVGPVDVRPGYLTPPGAYRGPALPGAAFVRLVSGRQAARARRLAASLWPVRDFSVKYPERAFMRPALSASLPFLGDRFFTNAIRR